jgi:hypothetical protein
MKPGLYFVPVLFLLASLPAFAATVESVKGKVLINRGDGFQPAASGAQAKAGDRLMADAGGSAKLVYPGGCQVKVIPGRVVSVGKQPPCTAPSLLGDADDRWYSNPLVPFGVTAAVGWGIFCGATYCRDDDDNGGGGRRRFNQQVGSPASP